MKPPIQFPTIFSPERLDAMKRRACEPEIPADVEDHVIELVKQVERLQEEAVASLKVEPGYELLEFSRPLAEPIPNHRVTILWQHLGQWYGAMTKETVKLCWGASEQEVRRKVNE